MESEEAVKQVYPNATAVMQNNGLIHISDSDENKMTPHTWISDRFKMEIQAWEDAAQKLRIGGR